MDELFPATFHVPPLFQHARVAWEESPAVKDVKCFYTEFCKFATIYKWLGCFPVKTSRFSNLYFSWTSTVTIMSVLALPTFSVFLWGWGSFGDYVEKLFSFVLIGFPLVNKILFTQKIPLLIKLIQLMDLVDTDCSLQLGDIELTKKDHRFILCFGTVLSIIVIFPHSLLTSGPIPSVVFYDFLHGYWMITCVTQVSIYCAVCYQMNHFFDRYLSSLKVVSDRPCEEVLENRIEDYRILHAKLMSCVRLMDDTFGFWLAYVYIITCVKFLLYCYYALHSTQPGQMGLTLLQITWLLIFVFYSAVLTDHLLRKNKKTMPFLVKMALKPFPDNTQFQINYFIRQLKINTASVSAAGLADVNKEIIVKTLSLFATSFVAVIQLEPQVQKIVTYLRRITTTT